MVEEVGKETVEKPEEAKKQNKNKKKGVWTVIGIVALILVVAGGASGGYMLHLSNTSPEFCSTCHIMNFNVTSYLTSNDLDNVHNQAGVQCKECHDYPVEAEITSGIKFLFGDYTVNAEGKLLPVTYDNEICLQCHISYEHVANSTDFLAKNPHRSHNGELAEGVHLDRAAILHYHQMYCANRIDSRLPKIWLNESAAAINWIGELLEKRGARFFYEGGYEPDFSPTTYPKFPTGHSGDFDEGVTGASIMQGYIEELGGKYYFETPFVKFEHEGKKVTAAIAKDKEGKYIRFVGKKSMVLATGGYQQNPAMLSALNPQDVMIMAKVNDGPTCGDGIKACLWMGAAMDEVHTCMIFDRMGLLPNETPATMTKPTLFWWGSQPWLKVNLKGERFTNESIPYDYAVHAAAKQPGKCYVSVFDSTYFDQIQQFQTVGCSRIFPFPNGSPNDRTGTDMTVIKTNADNSVKGWLESGHLQQADTFEELATKLNIPADTFAATVKRYNELADKGEDTDFYKDSYRLLALKTPPYYGIRQTGMILSTMDGIRINTEMRPMDDMNEPFEGLHVIGDSSGSYFAHTYPNLFTGYCNGRNTTYARRVARILAGEPVDLV